jgi:hypothetical protein
VEIYCILSRVLARRRYMRYGGNIIERASLGGWLWCWTRQRRGKARVKPDCVLARRRVGRALIYARRDRKTAARVSWGQIRLKDKETADENLG